MAKRPVHFLDELSSDEDDYYERQRKKAVLENLVDAPDANCLNGSSEGQTTIEEVVQDSPDTSFVEEETNPVVTEPEDESEEEPEESSSTPKVGPVRASCAYGDSCYRRNPQHKIDFSHPGDTDYVAPAGPSQGGAKPRCQYGSSCYRKNPQHKLDFDHSAPPSPEKPKKRLRDKKPVKKNDGDDYESDFIDDDEEEEEDYEESEEEWEPDDEED